MPSYRRRPCSFVCARKYLLPRLNLLHIRCRHSMPISIKALSPQLVTQNSKPSNLKQVRRCCISSKKPPADALPTSGPTVAHAANARHDSRTAMSLYLCIKLPGAPIYVHVVKYEVWEGSQHKAHLQHCRDSPPYTGTFGCAIWRLAGCSS
jgi:hypothetical protein